MWLFLRAHGLNSVKDPWFRVGSFPGSLGFLESAVEDVCAFENSLLGVCPFARVEEVSWQKSLGFSALEISRVNHLLQLNFALLVSLLSAEDQPALSFH